MDLKARLIIEARSMSLTRLPILQVKDLNFRKMATLVLIPLTILRWRVMGNYMVLHHTELKIITEHFSPSTLLLETQRKNLTSKERKRDAEPVI